MKKIFHFGPLQPKLLKDKLKHDFTREDLSGLEQVYRELVISTRKCCEVINVYATNLPDHEIFVIVTTNEICLCL